MAENVSNQKRGQDRERTKFPSFAAFVSCGHNRIPAAT